MPFSQRKKPLDEAALMEYALKVLGGRAVSTGELREKLRRKAERVLDIDPVIAKLKEYGYLNDKQFADNFAARRLENDGFGKARVLQDLRSRRVAPTLAERAVTSAFSATDELQLIEAFLARKFRRQPLPELLADQKGMASVYRKLRAAGFTHGNSLSVLKRHAKDAEVLDTIEPPEEHEPTSE